MVITSNRSSFNRGDDSPSRIVERGGGLAECDGVVGTRQVSTVAPHYGNSAALWKVECVDGTKQHYQSKLQDPDFKVKVSARSDSVDELAFPEGALEIEQHYYKGDIVEERYGEIDKSQYEGDIIREIPVYKKEIEEVVKRERVVNQIVERVPKYNYIDTVVDVDKVVEKPIYKEVPVKKKVVKQVPLPVKEQRLIEKVRYVPVAEEVEVERYIDIPGELIVQPRHVTRDECVTIDKHFDKEVPVVISQVVNPVMKDTKKKVRVPAKVLSPELHTANVRIPKPVDIELHVKKVDTELEWSKLTAEEYNSAFFQLNQHLAADHRQALRPNVHLYVDPITGYPIMRDGNLKFYRLPDEALENLHGYEPFDFTKHHKVPKERKVESTREIRQPSFRSTGSHQLSVRSGSYRHHPDGTPRSPLVETIYDGEYRDVEVVGEHIGSTPSHLRMSSRGSARTLDGSERKHRKKATRDHLDTVVNTVTEGQQAVLRVTGDDGFVKATSFASYNPAPNVADVNRYVSSRQQYVA